MINYILVGRRIKETRKLRRLSQVELAELTELSVSFISYIENAKRQVSLQSLVDIAAAMGITIDALLTGNQINANHEYQDDILIIMEDCTAYERRILFEQMLSLKASLRDNKCLLPIQATISGL